MDTNQDISKTGDNSLNTSCTTTKRFCDLKAGDTIYILDGMRLYTPKLTTAFYPVQKDLITKPKYRRRAVAFKAGIKGMEYLMNFLLISPRNLTSTHIIANDYNKRMYMCDFMATTQRQVQSYLDKRNK